MIRKDLTEEVSGLLAGAGSWKRLKSVKYLCEEHSGQRQEPVQSFCFFHVRFLQVLASLDCLKFFLTVTSVHFTFFIAKKDNIIII